MNEFFKTVGNLKIIIVRTKLKRITAITKEDDIIPFTFDTEKKLKNAIFQLKKLNNDAECVIL